MLLFVGVIMDNEREKQAFFFFLFHSHLCSFYDVDI